VIPSRQNVVLETALVAFGASSFTLSDQSNSFATDPQKSRHDASSTFAAHDSAPQQVARFRQSFLLRAQATLNQRFKLLLAQQSESTHSRVGAQNTVGLRIALPQVALDCTQLHQDRRQWVK
jgi:hypothetical protein